MSNAEFNRNFHHIYSSTITTTNEKTLCSEKSSNSDNETNEIFISNNNIDDNKNDENNNEIKIITPQNFHSTAPKPTDKCKNYKIDEILLIYPGVTGKSPDPYIKRLVDKVRKNNYSGKKILVAVMIQRGYDGLSIPKTCPKLNAATNTLDIKRGLQYLDCRFNTSSFSSDKAEQNKNNKNKLQITRVCAFSFGAIQTRLLLGGPKTSNSDLSASWYPKSALCNSCPFDLFTTTFQKFERLFTGLIYNKTILKRMCQIHVLHGLLSEKFPTVDSILSKCQYFRDFDNLIIAPAWGFNNWQEYYNTATLQRDHLIRLKLPVIFLNSKDDPLIADSPEKDQWFEEAENVLYVKTNAGAHGAFLKLGWLLKSSLAQDTYFEELFDEWMAMNF